MACAGVHTRYGPLSFRQRFCRLHVPWSQRFLISPVVGIAAEKTSQRHGHRLEGLRAIGINNFGRISETYFRGAQPDGQDYSDLAALGVKMVIDLQADGLTIERQLVESAGMKFFRIPMTTRKAPTSDDLSQFLQSVNDPANDLSTCTAPADAIEPV